MTASCRSCRSFNLQVRHIKDVTSTWCTTYNVLLLSALVDIEYLCMTRLCGCGCDCAVRSVIMMVSEVTQKLAILTADFKLAQSYNMIRWLQYTLTSPFEMIVEKTLPAPPSPPSRSSPPAVVVGCPVCLNVHCNWRIYQARVVSESVPPPPYAANAVPASSLTPDPHIHSVNHLHIHSRHQNIIGQSQSAMVHKFTLIPKIQAHIVSIRICLCLRSPKANPNGKPHLRRRTLHSGLVTARSPSIWLQLALLP